MKVSDLILLLQEFQENEGDQEVFITDSRYYCDEPIIEPQYPEVNHRGVWSIGHSHQSY